MNHIDILGLLAAFFTTIAFVPQAVQTIKTKDTSGISTGMYTILVLGVSLWLCYGILITDMPLIIANAVTFFLAGTILLMKIKHK